MLGNEGLAPPGGRKLRAGIKAQAQRGAMRIQGQYRRLGIGAAAAIAQRRVHDGAHGVAHPARHDLGGRGRRDWSGEDLLTEVLRTR